MGYCFWADTNEQNKVYHDCDRGVPVHDDRKKFEHLMPECMQCGLSCDMMLKKRDVFKTILYNGHNKACGIINDHDEDCPCFKRIKCSPH